MPGGNNIVRESSVLESADWFGRTGLGEEVERELPRYIRRELGQSVDAAGALQANDLVYLGVFPWGKFSVHYWRARLVGEAEDSYATILMHRNVPNYDWGTPPPYDQAERDAQQSLASRLGQGVAAWGKFVAILGTLWLALAVLFFIWHEKAITLESGVAIIGYGVISIGVAGLLLFFVVAIPLGVVIWLLNQLGSRRQRNTKDVK